MSAPLLRTATPAEIERRRIQPIDEPTLAAARTILDDIAARGDAAAIEHAIRLGDLRPNQPHFYTPADLAKARNRLPVAQRELLERTADRIRRFALAQRECLRALSMPIPGDDNRIAGEAGHDCIPIRTAACYAPGGRFPLPSSVLMTAVTARAAGVSQVWVASPRPTDATLAAAAIAGADGLLAIGGVQAIGAMAHGLCGLTPCDLIVGPGNRWVTAAKHLVSTNVGIDMLAGPSELLILADETANPAVVAADLLAQAEHDLDAIPMLVTTSKALIEAANEELRRQLSSLSTRAIAEGALANGFAVLADDITEAARLCDIIAPEHLEIMTADERRVASRIKNAGAIFIGSASAEVLGDYGAGPNHVLPTGGTSRFRAGLSVFTFLRTRTWLRIDDAANSAGLREDAAALARVESLEAHARSAEARL
jgi:phosphoribosyl-ATP pyrophosphohydrolase/phosphoribosyl-AMP cyclohydrolase/histidinol dehydrogenase